MALEATHIRFARDTKDLFAPTSDNGLYIAGSVYPDSRYPTGIERTLTHSRELLKHVFWEHDDFKKGWASHLLYDEIQYDLHTELFANLLRTNNPTMSEEEDWIVRSALKILQDIEDAGAFPIADIINTIPTHITPPHNENGEILQSYFAQLKAVYQHTPVTIAGLEATLQSWGVSEKHAHAMAQTAEKLSQNHACTEILATIYDVSITRSEEYFNRFCR